MAYWNSYFAIKLYLAWTGKLQPLWWLNLLLALLLLLPLRRRSIALLRLALAVAIAIALIFVEARLPSIARALEQLQSLGGFSPRYLLELATRIALPMVPWIVGLGLLAYAASQRLGKALVLAVLAAGAVPMWLGIGLPASPSIASAPRGFALARTDAPPARPAAGHAYDEQLAAFRAAEAEHRVMFASMPADPAEQFDIIVLHTCSLSWDDLDAANARNHPLLARLDYLFENFSTGTSYSNPTAIRLLRASCGQQPHEALFRPAAAGCRLFAQLAHAGYQPQALFNHDGQYGRFREVVEREIGIYGVRVKLPQKLPAAMIAFDGSSLASDDAMLRQWQDARVSQAGPPVALYYNTVSLHDGNRLVGSSLSSLQSYPQRLNTLLGDIERLVTRIERSGRRAAIVLVPEHGAALRGSGHQMAGMREVPTPEIVHVPVGLILAGLPPTRRALGGTVRIQAPSSYPALAQLLANFVADSPYRKGAPALSGYAANLPQTAMVGENEGVLTLSVDGGYVVRTGREAWLPAR